MKKIGFFGSIKRKLTTQMKSVTRAFQIPDWVFNRKDHYAKPSYQSSAAASSKRVRESIWTQACLGQYTQNIPSVAFIAQKWSEEHGDWIRAADHDIERLIERPNDYQPTHEFMSIVVTNLLKDGNALITIHDSEISGKTEKLEAMNTDGVFPVLDPVDLISEYRITKTRCGAVRSNDKFVEKKDMIHIRLPNSENLEWGISPLEAAINVQESESLALLWNKSILDNHGRPSFVLTTDEPLSKNQRRALVNALKEDSAGVANGLPLVLTHGVKPVSIGNSPIEMDYVKSSQLDATRICALLRVPPSLIGLVENATLTNVREFISLFWTGSIIPLLTIICQAFSHYWVQPRWGSEYRLWFDLSNVIELKHDLEKKIIIMDRLAERGYTVNEINRSLQMNLPEIATGNVRKIDGNIVEWGGYEPEVQIESVDKEPTLGMREESLGKSKKSSADDKRLDAIYSTLKSDRGAYIDIFRDSIHDRVNRDMKSLLELGVKGIQDEQTIANWKRSTLPLWENLLSKVWFDTASYFQRSFDKTYGVKDGRSKTKALGKADLDDIIEISKNRGSFILDTTSHFIIKDVHDFLEAGFSEAEVVAKIRANIPSLSEFRAQVIVENEIIAAGNMGSNVGAVRSGEFTEKTWKTQRDFLVRDAHAIMEGETRPLSSLYSNNLRYPGDPNGRPDQIINCRCFEDYA